ncbi:MAG: HAD family hydrolase [Thomasclavelia sp.]
MINTIIFDLDGTLVDSLTDLANTVNQILQEYNFPTYPIDQYRYFVGDGIIKLIERVLPKEHLDKTLKVKERFDQLYGQKCLENTKPYPGISELIEELAAKGYNLAVVTNKPHPHALKLVKTLFPDCFSYVFGNSPLHPKKPDPCLNNLVIDLFDVKKNQVVYIGDSNVDMLTAKNTKVKAIGVAWGFRGREELLASGANYVVEKPDEILELVNDWN